MRKILTPDFFDRPADQVARDLLGKYLVRSLNGKEIALFINETEAYLGEEDMASHARFGRTSRSSVMYGLPGVWYVYLIYGMYWLLNITCHSEDDPAAVLIRGAGEFHGPGKLTRALHIKGELNRLAAVKTSKLWIEDRGEVITGDQILKTPRIGINYAGPIWIKKKLRFVLKER